MPREHSHLLGGGGDGGAGVLLCHGGTSPCPQIANITRRTHHRLLPELQGSLPRTPGTRCLSSNKARWSPSRLGSLVSRLFAQTLSRPGGSPGVKPHAACWSGTPLIRGSRRFLTAFLISYRGGRWSSCTGALPEAAAHAGLPLLHSQGLFFIHADAAEVPRSKPPALEQTPPFSPLQATPLRPPGQAGLV